MKVLIVLTNTTHYGDTEDATGLWLGEATEFAAELQKHGISYDYVSPNGGYVPIDPRSMKYTNEEIMDFYNTCDFKQRALANSLPLEVVDPKNYDAIYFTGGHGVMWDFPNNDTLHKLALDIYKQGGYITSVCHGVAGLLNLQDDAGNYLITDKKITGFTTSEEILAGKKSVVPFLNEHVAKERGAHFQKRRPYSEFALQDGQFITGQNPFSVKAVAKLLLENFKN